MNSGVDFRIFSKNALTICFIISDVPACLEYAIKITLQLLNREPDSFCGVQTSPLGTLGVLKQKGGTHLSIGRQVITHCFRTGGLFIFIFGA